ncbi:MAG TPA: PPC domain-containing DNA-binding protein [Steroidobacteraceae bacterium]|nr:PPC domain-containing DNA-binding protein [Steroidobacteraceae bacterium]
MKHRLISPRTSASAQRAYAVILETGDEFTECLTGFARETGLTASQFSAIGAFSSVVLGYFDWEQKDYRRIPIDEQVEVVSLLGDIALRDGAPSLHPHVAVAKRDGSVWGGHLMEAIVRPTLEIVVTESPASLVRRYDPQTGLALIDVQS